ncbi:DUF6705 family protein [Kordia sp.]|uniref:DUF6705 family protein n=1 Tax=Kordia sp. TaxID=1965332 RepID=UPI003D6B029D
MKKINKTIRITAILSLLFCAFMSAQNEVIVPLEEQYSNIYTDDQVIYFKDVNNTLDKYVGTWKYEDANHFLQIQVTKKEHVSKGVPGLYNNPHFEDYISIDMLYKYNGVTKYTYQNTLMRGNAIESANSVELIYNEPSLTSCYRKKQADLLLQYVSSGFNTQLIWTRTRRLPNGLWKCPDGTEIDNSDFLIPANLTLTKQ